MANDAGQLPCSWRSLSRNAAYQGCVFPLCAPGTLQVPFPHCLSPVLSLPSLQEQGRVLQALSQPNLLTLEPQALFLASCFPSGGLVQGSVLVCSPRFSSLFVFLSLFLWGI